MLPFCAPAPFIGFFGMALFAVGGADADLLDSNDLGKHSDWFLSRRSMRVLSAENGDTGTI